MSANNRSALITKSHKVLKKHYSPVPPLQGNVLETLIYAACLENAKYEPAQTAFENIKNVSFDWNEVRVTAVTELAESMPGLPEPKQSAANVRRLLHGVFESIYAYDLEYLKKQNLGKSIKELSKHKGATSFVLGYVTQHALGGHAIPLDRGALDILYIIGVIDEKERNKEKAPGLERAIPKAKGMEYASLLHQLSADLVASPFSPKVRAILLELNPDCKERLPKRQTKKKKVVEKPKATKKAAAKSEPKAAKPAKKAAKKKPAKAAPKAAKKKTSKAKPKKKVVKKKAPAKKKTKKKRK
jgi:endonuclease-3